MGGARLALVLVFMVGAARAGGPTTRERIDLAVSVVADASGELLVEHAEVREGDLARWGLWAKGSGSGTGPLPTIVIDSPAGTVTLPACLATGVCTCYGTRTKLRPYGNVCVVRTGQIAPSPPSTSPPPPSPSPSTSPPPPSPPPSTTPPSTPPSAGCGPESVTGGLAFSCVDICGECTFFEGEAVPNCCCDSLCTAPENDDCCDDFVSCCPALGKTAADSARDLITAASRVGGSRPSPRGAYVAPRLAAASTRTAPRRRDAAPRG